MDADKVGEAMDEAKRVIEDATSHIENNVDRIWACLSVCYSLIGSFLVEAIDSGCPRQIALESIKVHSKQLAQNVKKNSPAVEAYDADEDMPQ